jgi:uncharacterized protein GlcG (DUF336 family)
MSSKSTSSAQALHRPAHLTLIAAQVASAACERKAQEINMPMNIAIVDASLYLLHFTRMPGAKLTSIDISQSKAFTAAGHRNPTSSYKDMVWPGGAAFGLNSSNGGKFMYVGGGVPIKVDGECIGAIGCSNGTPAQDAEVRVFLESSKEDADWCIGRSGGCRCGTGDGEEVQTGQAMRSNSVHGRLWKSTT